MRTRSRLLVRVVGVLAVVAVGVIGVVLYANLRNRASDWLVGSWEGQGLERSNMEVAVGEKKASIALSTRISATTTFHADGTLNHSFKAEAEGFRFAYTLPDPAKPGEVAKWAIIRSDRNGLVVRLGDPDGPEYLAAFRDRDTFAMTPLDPAKGMGTILFRRAGGR